MPLKLFHKRYVNIVNKSLSFVKDYGFTKKSTKYVKEVGDLIYEFGGLPDKYNSETEYGFVLYFSITTTNKNYLEIYKLIMEYKKLDKADLFYKGMLPDNYPKGIYLRKTDSEEFDENYIKGFQSKIKREFIPWVDKFSSFEDFVAYAEMESTLPKDERKVHPGIYQSFLYKAYFANGLIEKAWQMYEVTMVLTHESSRRFMEEKKPKIIKFLKSKGYKV